MGAAVWFAAAAAGLATAGGEWEQRKKQYQGLSRAGGKLGSVHIGQGSGTYVPPAEVLPPPALLRLELSQPRTRSRTRSRTPCDRWTRTSHHMVSSTSFSTASEVDSAPIATMEEEAAPPRVERNFRNPVQWELLGCGADSSSTRLVTACSTATPPPPLAAVCPSMLHPPPPPVPNRPPARQIALHTEYYTKPYDSAFLSPWPQPLTLAHLPPLPPLPVRSRCTPSTTLSRGCRSTSSASCGWCPYTQ